MGTPGVSSSSTIASSSNTSLRLLWNLAAAVSVFDSFLKNPSSKSWERVPSLPWEGTRLPKGGWDRAELGIGYVSCAFTSNGGYHISRGGSAVEKKEFRHVPAGSGMAQWLYFAVTQVLEHRF